MWLGGFGLLSETNEKVETCVEDRVVGLRRQDVRNDDVNEAEMTC